MTAAPSTPIRRSTSGNLTGSSDRRTASAARAAAMGGVATTNDSFHRRFPSVDSYVSELGGDKGRVIEKVLIANNGVAAVKAIRSVRRWAYEVFGDERAISFVVMATPEDLRANAEYIRMGDTIVDVPGGSNNHNYANVTLIVELARLHGVQAVWAGWGHASENPILPDTLAKSDPPIKFIGPAGPPMRALGDKIGSTIIAQSAGVPCIGWNGSHVKAEYSRETGSLPADVYEAATVRSVAEASEAAEKVGFPVMIKASEGGGGKGIRMVERPEDVPAAYRQVCGEVPGSPIFIMKLSSQSRHLEVQLLADEYGNAVALNGRDCSVQRRHQKIIEEGPPVAAPPAVWTQMERAAVSLAKAVGYTNAGTVEYLYSETDEKFYFLELNPRLQVEHPVTEMITGVNLPAAQLQVAMGIPLYHIPEVRELYGENRFEDADSPSEIDFDVAERVEPRGHCIAVRITAENAEAGFKPTSGGIQELNFRSTPNVWGYFSMDSSGSIHEFADSQFGHLFANGPDREQARRNMVLALKELSIRGDISTTVDYISRLIELDDFVNNDIDTGWLDELIKNGIDGDISPDGGDASGGADGAPSASSTGTQDPVLTPKKKKGALNNHTYAVIGAAVGAYDRCSLGESQFVEALNKGQLPSRGLLGMFHTVELILDGVKYSLRCTRTGASTFYISLCQPDDEGSSPVSEEARPGVETNVRVLSDGGYLIALGGKSHVAYLTSRGDAAIGMRLNVGGVNVAFSPDYDPSSLRTDVAGKLVKRIVPDGAHVTKGEPYAEIEVMKMFMPLRVEETGTLSWNANEGASLTPGDLLASLELDNPENVATPTVFGGDLDVEGWHAAESGGGGGPAATSRPHILLRGAQERLKGGIAGYVLSEDGLEQALVDMQRAADDPALPVFEIEEQLSVLSGRIDAQLFSDLSTKLSDFKKVCEENAVGKKELRFPAEEIEQQLDDHQRSFTDTSEQGAFTALTALLREAVAPYVKKHPDGVAGSERALGCVLDILREWIAVERWFCDAPTYADAVYNLRKANKEDFDTVLRVCRANSEVASTSRIVSRLMDIIGDGGRPAAAQAKRVTIPFGADCLVAAEPCLAEIRNMGGNEAYANVALKARRALLQESLPSITQRRSLVMSMVDKMSAGGSDTYKEVHSFVQENVAIADIFFPILKEASTDESRQMSLMELYARRLLRSYTVTDAKALPDELSLKVVFMEKQGESVLSTSNPVTSMTDLTRIVSRSSSLSNLGELSESDSESNLLVMKRENRPPPMTPRTAIFMMLDSLDEVEGGAGAKRFEDVFKGFPQFVQASPKCKAGPINNLHIVVRNENLGPEQMDAAAEKCKGLLNSVATMLEKADIRRVSFMFDQVQNSEGNVDAEDYPMPAIFTYRERSVFEEDKLFRHIEPGYAVHLEMQRFTKNFDLRSLDSRHMTTGHVHLYEAKPRRTALKKDATASKSSRIFVRALSFVGDFTSTTFERILVDALNALDLSAHNLRTSSGAFDNHLFINMIGDYEKVFDPLVIEQVVGSILVRHGDRITRLGIAEVETRLVCRLSGDNPPIAIRLVASNPTGYVRVMNTYVEAANDTNTKRVYKLVGGTKTALAGSGDSSWEGCDVHSPYPLTRPFDAQRKAAAKASDTLYCYDVPALFEAAVENQWSQAAKSGGGFASCRPLMLMYTTELVVQKKSGAGDNEDWTMADYMKGNLEMVQVQRGAGGNDVGMVAWLMVLKTVEYPEGREMVIIANDITFRAGSFGTREDVVFKMASDFARAKRIPRIYVAANSGARIGLADGVKNLFQVAFKDPSKPENGFKYLYVTENDYEQVKSYIKTEEVLLDGKTVHRITDVIGSEPDLGVENLKGSGLIAGETSAAYNDIFTMTIVLGRTVGIGAYLVRLGQRTIQKTTASPIILTGYQALNKLMGCDVYSTNDQLGGPGIMYSNGVSHLISGDHLGAITHATNWLSYVPHARGGILPIADIRGVDVTDRSIDFTPSPGVPYDPRHLLTGREDDEGVWQSGFFDKGSFTETLAGWAKSVVVGRARLGGIPMGVIATENRTTEAIKPADPADVKASEAVIQEAGCVWFPNSAYKTAQAINDFRTEDLPLIVFANWRGFSGGQRDMFDEVLKYGSLIVDAFVAYDQPVFVYIPPFAEVRGGAWVVLDSSINSSVMEMYAAKGTARGGVLEPIGAANVKYKTKDLLATMHRVDETLKALRAKNPEAEEDKKEIQSMITKREQALLPVYSQIAVQFCDLHDTPGRMKAVGVIEQEVEWKHAREFFFWRLRRKLAEFDLRKKIQEAAEVGRGVKSLSPNEASALIESWYLQSPGMSNLGWDNDNAVLGWMGQNHADLEEKVKNVTKECVVQEVLQVMTAGGTTAEIGTAGLVEGMTRAYDQMSKSDKDKFKNLLRNTFDF